MHSTFTQKTRSLFVKYFCHGAVQNLNVVDESGHYSPLVIALPVPGLQSTSFTAKFLRKKRELRIVFPKSSILEPGLVHPVRSKADFPRMDVVAPAGTAASAHISSSCGEKSFQADTHREPLSLAEEMMRAAFNGSIGEDVGHFADNAPSTSVERISDECEVRGSSCNHGSAEDDGEAVVAAPFDWVMPPALSGGQGGHVEVLAIAKTLTAKQEQARTNLQHRSLTPLSFTLCQPISELQQMY